MGVKIAQQKNRGGSGALECLECKRRHSVEEVAGEEYLIETMTCASCYRSMQLAPHKINCFGKPTVIELSGQRSLGYDRRSEECGRCRDRAVCGRLVADTHAGSSYDLLVEIK